MSAKKFYRIQEVSELLDIPVTTLRYWERVFPMFNPNRLPSGQRRFTQSDVKTVAKIKELLCVKGMTIDGAIMEMNKTHRTSPPHPPKPCRTAKRAITLLHEAMGLIENRHALSKIEAVVNYLNTFDNGRAKAD